MQNYPGDEVRKTLKIQLGFSVSKEPVYHTKMWICVLI